jgi:hypothetical protein
LDYQNQYSKFDWIEGSSGRILRICPLIDAAHRNELSLAIFKPTRILDFTWEATERDWDPDKVDEMRSVGDQGELFGTENWRDTLKLVDKLPYKFFYEFADEEGRESRLQVLDWEAGGFYWNCLRNAEGDEGVALQKSPAKIFRSIQRD